MKFIKQFFKDEEILGEAELLAAYRRTREIRLVGHLYQPYMQMVFAICYRYLRDEDESKDAVMNIFEKLMRDLKTQEVTNLKSWLHTVARNHCLMQIRLKNIFVTMDSLTDSEEENTEVSLIDDDEHFELENNLSALENCMRTLIDEQRVSINLFFIENKCYREISEQTGFDFNKVKSYIQNGKRNLKICMDRNGKR